jgi:hypothetical protein
MMTVHRAKGLEFPVVCLADLGKDGRERPDPSELCEPMRWIWRGFCAGLPSEGTSGVHVDTREGRDVQVRWTLCTPATLDEVLPPEDRAPTAVEAAEEPAYEQPLLELGLPPAPRALAVSRLSYSGLEAYRRCGYRFFLERSLKLAPVDAPHVEQEDPADPGLGALLRGTVVHGLLERLDFGLPVVPPDADVAAAIEMHGVEALPGDVADIRAMLERVAASELRARIAGARRVRTELPFAFTLAPPGAGGRSLLINGVVDVLADEGARTLVVDWKSDPLDEREPEDVVAESYSTQRVIYALAALRAGAEVVEVAHCFLERPDEPAVALYEATDEESLERELLGLAQGVVEGRFEPSTEPKFSLCADCPGRAALCVHEPELTLRLSVGSPS